MSGAVQREELMDEVMYQATGTEDCTPLTKERSTGTPPVLAVRSHGAGELQRQAAERLAAHRSRRAAQQAMQEALEESVREREASRAVGRGGEGSARVREAVKARYEQSVSYREFLAMEAERALELAQAEAEAAARKVKAASDAQRDLAAQMELMAGLEQWGVQQGKQPEPGPREVALAERLAEERRAEVRGDLAHALVDIALGAKELQRETEATERRLPGFEESEENAAEVGGNGLRVQLFEELWPRQAVGMTRHSAAPAGEHELHELEQEIAFRLAPEFEPHVMETVAIPGNVIEFPRQLVAPRKARPRLAEGPLRDEAPVEPQLRIFEVAPEQISSEPVAPVIAAGPEWQGLLLDAAKAAAPAAEHHAAQQFTLPPQIAPVEHRLMAAAVDAACIGAAFVGFATLVVELTGTGLRVLPLPMVAACGAAVLALLFVAYQMLFFSLSEATPGMRYARLGLCTFGDRNPTRKALRRRVLATVLAACPLGLGLAWVFMDDERLGWHDRISRMYQRGY